MKKVAIIGIIILGMLFTISALAADVIQGECLSYDKASKIVKLREYDTNFSKEFKYGQPTPIESTLDLSKAHIGIQPEPHDIMRIAYKVEGNRKIGIKVMNVSKQDLSKK